MSFGGLVKLLTPKQIAISVLKRSDSVAGSISIRTWQVAMSSVQKGEQEGEFIFEYDTKLALLRHLRCHGFSRLFQVWGKRGITIDEMCRGLAANHKFRKSIMGMVGSQNNRQVIQNDNGRWKVIGDAPYMYKNYERHSNYRSEVRRELPPEGVERIKEIAKKNRPNS